MFNFLKRKKNQPGKPEESEISEVKLEPTQPADTQAQEPSSTGVFKRLQSGLSKTRKKFTQGLGNVVFGKKLIDEALLEEIEEQLLMADVGVEACTQISQNLTEQISRKALGDAEALMFALKTELVNILQPSQLPLKIDTEKNPYVILMTGVNGAGKTTTIGKLAKSLQKQGKTVMLAAGDTFRAAAIDQLKVWGERNDISVIAQKQGSDSASVAYDAFASAKAKNIDVLLIDTAGRLHTQNNLMEELAKVKRVLSKIDSTAPHETLLVLDAGNGQNALSQAKEFQKAVGVSGVVLTKLDGTAKGGIAFAVAKSLGLPIRFIGVGEKIDDLKVFYAEDFVDALFVE